MNGPNPCPRLMLWVGVRLSVCHKPVFYWNGWTRWAGFRYRDCLTHAVLLKLQAQTICLLFFVASVVSLDRRSRDYHTESVTCRAERWRTPWELALPGSSAVHTLITVYDTPLYWHQKWHSQIRSQSASAEYRPCTTSVTSRITVAEKKLRPLFSLSTFAKRLNQFAWLPAYFNVILFWTHPLLLHSSNLQHKYTHAIRYKYDTIQEYFNVRSKITWRQLAKINNPDFAYEYRAYIHTYTYL